MKLSNRLMGIVNWKNIRPIMAGVVYFGFILTVIIELPKFVEFFIYGMFGILLAINGNTPHKKLGKRLLVVLKELLFYIPIIPVSIIISSVLTVGTPENQVAVDNIFAGAPWQVIFVIVVVCGPLLEEGLFRWLPRQFIKGELLYIVFSSLIFGMAHVIEDPYFFPHLIVYAFDSFWWSYRYYKTDEFWVPVAMHMFNNFLASFVF